jgi:crotonobetainyl-CoA:carnitine CoA-transferase CaiB-like acyl-CoA transferase
MSDGGESLRVVELCDGIAGPLCGRHLVLLGAHVERVESPGGDPARSWGLRAPGALHALLADGKAPRGPSSLSRADIVLADTGRVNPAALPEASAPRLLVLFEREALMDGSLAGGDTVVQALLGLTDYVGDGSSAPARTGADIAAVNAGIAGAQAVLAWLLASKQPGWSVARVSALRALAALKTVIWAARTAPDAWDGSHVVARDRRADRGYRVRDGWITLDFPYDSVDAWRSFCERIGVDERVRDAGDRWWETVGWGDDVDAARPFYEAALAGLGRDEACELVRRHGGSSVPFNTPAEVLRHAQTEVLDANPGRLPWRVLSGPDDACLLQPEATDTHSAHPPLRGLNVLDFGIGGVAPFAGSLLAQLGACVIKVEAPNDFIHAVRPASQSLSTTYSALNVGKRSTDLNLKDPGDLARARALLVDADVVLQNFRPGVMERLGLGYADAAALNSRIVYIAASGFGSIGPLSTLPCTDPHIQAFGGWALANAPPGGPPRRTRYYALLDLATSMVIVEAAMAGLYRRTRDGRSSHIEVAMLEAVVHLHISRWTGAGVTDDGAGGERLFAPDGIFATTDGYVALSVEDDAAWRRLLVALGRPATLRRPEWQTNRGRLQNEADLNAELGALLAGRSSQAWTQTLARERVPAGRLMRDDDTVLRKDLWDDGYLTLLRRHRRPALHGGGPPWRFELPLPALVAPSPGGDILSWRDARCASE